MQLTQLQLDIMKWSDKSLTFWCILWCDNVYKRYIRTDDWWHHTCVDFDDVIWWFYWFNEPEIIWHPMSRGRLCYLWLLQTCEKWSIQEDIYHYFIGNEDLYQQTVLERDEETCKLVLSFLNTLWS